MNHDWNADLLLTQHFDTPIRFYLHERSIDLIDIKMHIHDRVHGVDSKGSHHLLHKEDILFAIPAKKIKNLKDHIKMFSPVKSLKLNRKSVIQQHYDVTDSKLELVIGNDITIVTRRGHVILGELQTFDKDHLFMRVGKEIVLIYRNGLFGFKEEVYDSLRQNQNLHELHKRRKKWVEANRENNFEEGIKHVLTDLYPDDAHFIYELLQNAEDAGASKVLFVLNKDSAIFEHNGNRLFSLKDVEAITSIGFSTKKDDPTSIGKFGIGFKAVFAYTATPEIESGEFHFRIRDIVVPDTEGLFPGTLGEEKTRFVFPFDNPKKTPEKARAEIEKNLRELNENTLLFLSNIRKVEYRLPDSTIGSLERREIVNDENRIEIYVTRPRDQTPKANQYLRLTKEINVQDEGDKPKRCRIAVAFSMGKSEGGGWKITPLSPGQVSIYFPAVKETSKLRFHLHAPFASTVARDSVRDCLANDELRDHLADLVAESMHVIRDNNWLDVEFLAILPNDRDSLRPFYLPIQERLIREFNEKKLVPMKQEGHAPAARCYRGSRTLSDLINDKDLATLLEKDRNQFLWIANPPQINQPEDNFLSMLRISRWSIENLIETLDTNEKVTEWLKNKPDAWHQQLYAFLEDEAYLCSNFRIVRCSVGGGRYEYKVGNDCHFPDDDVGLDEEQDEKFHYVAKGVYSSGENKNQQKKAHFFLEKIGVCKVDEAERIKAILKQRYEDPNIEVPLKLHEEDMKRFIAFIENEPDKADLFKDYCIFKTFDHGSFDGCWGHKASIVFLDSPYLETGLDVYYEDDEYWEFVNEGSVDPYLSLDYEESNIDPKKIGKFAAALGARARLEAKEQMIPENHPEWENHLSQGSRHWRADTGIDKDYRIPEFQILVANPSIVKSKLFWQTMCSLPESCLKAQFRWNQSNRRNEGYSSLVYELRKAKWIPQKNGDSISFVRPCDALKDYLPGGFPYDTEHRWLEAIEFGKTAKQQRLDHIHKEAEQNLRNRRAAEMGFNSADEANTMVEIVNALKEQGKSPEELRDKLTAGKRRKERILIELEDAPEKEYEKRLRSVRVTAGTIDRRTHLRVRYTTDNNKMECQMCRQDMPFKKRNSDEDYFEAVEALKKRHFPKEHEAQHLALCPQCAAKYKEFVKRDTATQEVLYKLLKNSDGPEVRLPLNDFVIRIWFEQKHWDDLQAIIDYYEKAEDSEESTD